MSTPLPNGQPQQKKKGFLGQIVDTYNPKVMASNWKKVQGSPYASLKFQYMVTRILIIVIIAVVVWQLTMLVIRYDGGSNGYMTMIGRGVIILVMVMVVVKAWGALTPLKNAMKQYEAHPVETGANEFSNINVGKEVDEILDEYDKKNIKPTQSKINSKLNSKVNTKQPSNNVTVKK
jgi:uncharacterized membrane protein YcjF (UPF0283 family)